MEPDDPSVPDPKSESPESGRIAGDQGTPHGRPELPLTHENLAALLLRVLGLYFTAHGIIDGVVQASYLVVLSKRLGLEDALGHYHLEYLASPAAALIVGLYSDRRTMGVRQDIDSRLPQLAGG